MDVIGFRGINLFNAPGWGDPTIIENLFCPPSSRSMFPGTFASQGHCQIVLLAAILVGC